MSISLAGKSLGTVAEIEGTTYRALISTPRPAEYKSYGFFYYSGVTGLLPSSFSASNIIFHFRWGDMTRLALIHKLECQLQTITLFAAGASAHGFGAFRVADWPANGTGGTGATLTGNNFKTRTSMGSSLVSDIRIATTAGLAQSFTLDSQAFAVSLGDLQRVYPTTGTEDQRVNKLNLKWESNIKNGDPPMVLSRNQGIALVNRTTWPLNGTAIMRVQMTWEEVDAY